MFICYIHINIRLITNKFVTKDFEGRCDNSLPKEVLIELIDGKHYLFLLSTLVVFILTWIVMLKLGLIIIGSTLQPNKVIFPWSLFGVIYSLTAKQIIPDFLYFFTTLLVLFIFLKVITKTHTVKVFFAAIISLLSSIFSLLLLGQPLLINSVFREFLSGPKGIVFGTLLETIIPFFFVIVLSNSKQSKKYKSNTYFLNVTANIFLLLSIYCLSAIIFYFLANYHDSILWHVIISEVILFGITLFVLFRIRIYIKKEQQRTEENHSTYLLRTILSKQREYRNFFQVIRAMAERGRNQNIVDYIDNILADMSLVEECNGVNPIFAAFQVAEQIKAKEKGVKISTTTKSTLNHLKDPVKVYDIFKDLLQYFVAYEERVIVDEHHIIVEIDEMDQDYIFIISRKNGIEESRAELKTLSLLPEGERTLEQIAKRIRRLRGKVCFLYMEDELKGCQFRVAKAKPINFLYPV